MYWLLYGLGSMATVAGVFYLYARSAGAKYPPDHTFTRAVRLPKSPEEVFRVVTDFGAQVRWQPFLKSAERVADRDGREAWREQQKQGPAMLLVTREVEAPRRLVREIVDEKKVFTGDWTWELAPEGDGTLLRVTEHGNVPNPFYRFMVHRMGPSKYVDAYLRGLAAHLGAPDAPLER